MPTLIVGEDENVRAKITNPLSVRLGDGTDPISLTNPLPTVGNSKLHEDLEGKGYVAVGTTAVELTFTGVTEAITISAKDTNTGIIFIGKSTVTNLGANSIDYLMPGWSITIDYKDTTNAIYVVSDTAAQSVMAGALK